MDCACLHLGADYRTDDAGAGESVRLRWRVILLNSRAARMGSIDFGAYLEAAIRDSATKHCDIQRRAPGLLRMN